VVGCVADLLKAYQVANSRKDEATTKVNTNDLIWEAPNNDFVKNRMKMRVEVIVKDGKVEVLATLSSPRVHITELDFA
jgi:hypothetical protein